ncbi:MAG: DUF3822 family protein [Ekhidna sp.]|nr:DUF3822 family protein [Ekhidna sp.]
MVVKDTSTYKRVERIKDSGFSIDELDHYSLVMQIGIYDLQFAVIDSRNNQCLAIEDYRLKGIRTVNGRLKLVKQILDNHEFLIAGFWKDVKLCLKTHKFTLIPANMFLQENAADYLALNSEIKTSFEEVYYYKQISVDTVNVFAVEIKLCRWIESIYKKKKVHIIHQGSALVEGILKHADHIEEKGMYCYIDRGILHILVTENHKLLYYNQFAARKKQDYLKYILLVFSELGMNNKRHQVFLWGFIRPSSEEMILLKKYIRNISFGSKPSFLKFRHVFDEIEDHQYFDVMSGYLCM